MSPDLHVALFEDVQEAHLDALGEIRQFVDREDAAVDPRHETEMNRQFVVEVAPLGNLDGVHLADQVGDGDVGCSKLLGVPLGPGQPGDGRVVARFRDDGAALGRDRLEGVFGDLGTLDDGRLVVEQVGEPAHDPGLRLAAFT